jgi:hypothetical protein
LFNLDPAVSGPEMNTNPIEKTVIQMVRWYPLGVAPCNTDAHYAPIMSAWLPLRGSICTISSPDTHGIIK